MLLEELVASLLVVVLESKILILIFLFLMVGYQFNL
jgi:hypothetical protein